MGTTILMRSLSYSYYRNTYFRIRWERGLTNAKVELSNLSVFCLFTNLTPPPTHPTPVNTITWYRIKQLFDAKSRDITIYSVSPRCYPTRLRLVGYHLSRLNKSCYLPLAYWINPHIRQFISDSSYPIAISITEKKCNARWFNDHFMTCLER